MIKQISQANFVVHDRLQTFYTFQLNSIPFGVAKNDQIKRQPTLSDLYSLSKAFVQNIEDLLQSLVTKVLHPIQAVVGQGHSQRFYAVELLGERQLRVGEELDVVRWGVKLGPGHGLAVHGQHVSLLVDWQHSQGLLLLLRQVHILQHLLKLLQDILRWKM